MTKQAHLSGRKGSFKSVFKSLMTDGGLYALQPIMNNLIRFLLIPLYTACLTPENFGDLQFIMAFGTVAVTFLEMGLGSSFWKFRAEPEKYDSSEVVLNIFMMQTICGLLLIVAGAVVKTLFFSESVLGVFILIYIFSQIVHMLVANIQLILRAQRRVLLYLTVVFSHTIGLALLNVGFLAGLHLNYHAIIYSHLIMAFATLALFARILKGEIGGRARCGLIRELWLYGYPIMLANIAAFTVSFSGNFILKWLKGPEELGLFSYGNKFADLVKIFLITPITMAWNPIRWEVYRMSNGKEIFARLNHLSSALFPFIGLLVLMITAVLGQVMARNKEYTAGLVVLAPLIFSQVLYALYYFNAMGLLFESKTGIIRNIIFGCSLISLALNFLLIPRFGMQGAAFAVLIAYAFMYAVGRFYSQKYYPIQRHNFHEWLQLGLILAYIPVAAFILSRSPSLWITGISFAGLALLHLAGNWASSKTFRDDAKNGWFFFQTRLRSKMTKGRI